MIKKLLLCFLLAGTVLKAETINFIEGANITFLATNNNGIWDLQINSLGGSSLSLSNGSNVTFETNTPGVVTISASIVGGAASLSDVTNVISSFVGNNATNVNIASLIYFTNWTAALSNLSYSLAGGNTNHATAVLQAATNYAAQVANSVSNWVNSVSNRLDLLTYNKFQATNANLSLWQTFDTNAISTTASNAANNINTTTSNGVYSAAQTYANGTTNSSIVRTNDTIWFASPASVASKQGGSAILTNLSGTGALTNSSAVQASSIVLSNIVGSGALTNASAYQASSMVLSNLVGTASTTVTNRSSVQASSIALSNLSANVNVATNIVGSGIVTVSSNNAGVWTISASSAAGPSIVTNSIYIAAGAWAPASNGPAAIAMTNGFDVVDMYSFDDTVNESVCVRWTPPVGFAGLLSPNLYWEAQTWATATASSNIVWELSAVPSITNQTPLGGVVWTTGATTTNRAWSSNFIEVATLPVLMINSNLQPRAFLSLRLTRHGTNATSKLTGDARFLGMQLSFIQTNLMGGF